MQSEPSLAGAGPVGVLSPHLDDAALSCGQLLINRPGSHVVTAFSDGPVVKKVPSWEVASGMFKPGDDVMAVRRSEDVEALSFAQAHAHHLGFWDLQFRPPLSVPLGRLRPAARTARKEAEKSRLVSEVATRPTTSHRNPGRYDVVSAPRAPPFRPPDHRCCRRPIGRSYDRADLGRLCRATALDEVAGRH